jgi:tRNA (adenine57-N1/adenine58-N1)-methyltransferase catalytic subunit
MPDETPFRAGEPVLLIDERRGKRHLIVLRPGQHFHTDRGYIGHDALVGAIDGTTVKTSLGIRYLALRPTLGEYVLEMPRGAQVIYPKDLATICFFADVGPGQTAVEAGLGSGALTLALLRAVGPSGRVVSYETREDFARRAQRNIEIRLGPDVPLTVRLQDVYAGIEERGVDRLLLDLAEPWRLVAPAADALRGGGVFCAYLPTLPQAQRTHEALAAHAAFALVDTFETLLRPWHIAGLSVRPAHRMVAHTGFITLARRVQPRARDAARIVPLEELDEPPEPEPA